MSNDVLFLGFRFRCCLFLFGHYTHSYCSCLKLLSDCLSEICVIASWENIQPVTSSVDGRTMSDSRLRFFRVGWSCFAQSIVVFFGLLINDFDFFNFPQTVENVVEIGLVFSFLQKNVGFSRSFEIGATQIFVILRVNKVNNIVIFYVKLVRFDLKLIMQNHLKHSFRNVFVDNLKPSCMRKFVGIRCCLILNSITDLVVPLFLEMEVLDLRILCKVWCLVVSEGILDELFIYKKIFKAVGYITLGFTMVDSEWCIDTDFITLFFIGSIGHELEDILFGQLLSQSDFKGPYTRRGAVNRAANVILGVYVLKDYSVSEGNVLSSLFRDHGLELFLLGLRPLELFFLTFFIHLIVDFERRSWKDFE